MKSITLTLLLSFLFISCTPKAQTATSTTNKVEVIANSVEVIDATSFKQQIEAKTVQLIDIRTPDEFNQAHIEGSINYNYYQRTFMSQMSTLDKSKPIYIYCRSGNRTGSASRKLKAAGFTKIYDLKGGINYWLRTGYKLIN